MQIGFKSFHPISSLLYYIFALIFSLSASHPLCISAAFIGSFAYSVKLKKRDAVLFLIKFVLPISILASLINGFFSHYGVTVLFTMKNSNNITLEAFVYGFVFAIKSGCVMLMLFGINEILTSEKTVFLFGKISPKLALVITMSLRFIPLLFQQGKEIELAQKGIGAGKNNGNIIIRIKNASKKLSVLVSWTLEKGIDTYHSMKARGFGLKHTTSYNAYIFSKKDITFTILIILSFVLMILSKNTLLSYYNPIITIPFDNIKVYLFSFYFFAVMVLPLIIDISEEKKWLISA